MRTLFRLIPWATLLILSRAAIAAESAIEPGIATSGTDSRLILLHQPAPRVGQLAPEQVQAAVLSLWQNQARRLYAPLFADLQLTELQIDTLTQLIAERETLSSGWSTDGVNFTPHQENPRRAREVLAQIERLLGAGAFQRFTEYRDTLSERFKPNR